MKRLLVGYKASDLTQELLAGGDVLCHALDVYHAHAIEKVWHAKTVCSAHLPPGPWDEVFFKTGPKLSSAELSLDLLQECASLVGHDLKPPRFRLDFVGRERDRNDLLDKVRKDAKRVRSFRATWPASVPGGPTLTFASYPGCFCHRRLDEGGLALAEVVCRELDVVFNAEAQRRGEEKLRLLDMGCGCGLVGLLIATRFGGDARPQVSLDPQAPQVKGSRLAEPPATSPISLTLVDSHVRAIEAATENAASFGVPAKVLLSDSGTPSEEDGTFDVFVGNPPYYSDYRIADVFLETARRALKKGGLCFSVCKNAAGLEPVQARYFPHVEVIKRRGYAVLKSEA